VRRWGRRNPPGNAVGAAASRRATDLLSAMNEIDTSCAPDSGMILRRWRRGACSLLAECWRCRNRAATARRIAAANTTVPAGRGASDGRPAGRLLALRQRPPGAVCRPGIRQVPPAVYSSSPSSASSSEDLLSSAAARAPTAAARRSAMIAWANSCRNRSRSAGSSTCRA